MKQFLIGAALICAPFIHTAADSAAQTIHATEQIAGAWATFSAWKKEHSASERANNFTKITGLQASVAYQSMGSLHEEVPGGKYRLGLTGLKIGKNNIDCFVAHKDDPIERLTKQRRELHDYPRQCDRPLYPTIWHFLESEKGKQIIEEYIQLHYSTRIY